MLTLLALYCTLQAAQVHHLWLEAESFGPLRGSNFSFQKEEAYTKGSWSIAGPDAAAAWTQGGESEFMSIAARRDEPGELVCGRDVEIPASDRYALWVRYADYREKEEAFGVRITQGARSTSHIFGMRPVVDELDPMKLLWGWSYGWDHSEIALEKGPAHIEIYTTGVSGARRCVDCLCLTTDPGYRPVGREKPDFAAWGPLREMRHAGMPAVQPLVSPPSFAVAPKPWQIANGPPSFLWNVGQPWLDELKRAASERIDWPFGVDPPLIKDFLAAYRLEPAPIYSHSLSGPVWHIPMYPQLFAKGSPFLDWLARQPDRKFAILLNYGDPTWPDGADRAAIRESFARFADRFVGFIAGEGIAYNTVDQPSLDRRIRAAKSRQEVLEALRDENTKATVAKFKSYLDIDLTPEQAWAPVISCLSASNEAYCHALCEWGVRKIGHENTGNSPTLARRLAFLRGACRQFGAQLVDYQSCNLGDAATMFSRENYFYGASSRYILDNSYDAFAGAGLSWLLRDYLLWHLAGVSAFYNEQGIDLFWKPGGNSAGDDFPVQLSPKGRVAEAALKIAANHPRGIQWTPVAFLLDEAHGYTQERFSPGAFGLDPELNPAVLRPGKHEAAIRAWFDIAYFPAPETQGEPASGIRQTYVNGIFGDIFDVIVNAPGRTAILPSYPVIVVAGEVTISAEWGRALREYMRRGGTLVISSGQASGPGAKELDLPPSATDQEAKAFTWFSGRRFASNVYRYHVLPTSPRDKLLATDPSGRPIAIARKQGSGQLILVGVPLGLGIDERPVPLLGLLLRHLTEALSPVRIAGDVEWILNRLEDGRWLVSLINNRGVIKPQHGINPTDHREAVTVEIQAAFPIEKTEEWIAGEGTVPRGNSLTLTIPAGSVRLLALTPQR